MHLACMHCLSRVMYFPNHLSILTSKREKKNQLSKTLNQILFMYVCMYIIHSNTGSIYWSKGAFDAFRKWDAGFDPDPDPDTGDTRKSLPKMVDLLKDAFTFENGPIWMDASTTKYCRELEAACGGSDGLAQVTGVRCYERFLGIQVYKRMIETETESSERMDATERVSLVSSMIGCLFLCDYAPMDMSDGCGSGLVDIYRRQWGRPIPCDHFPSGSGRLLGLLGELVDSHSVIGYVHPYLQARCVSASI